MQQKDIDFIVKKGWAITPIAYIAESGECSCVEYKKKDNENYVCQCPGKHARLGAWQDNIIRDIGSIKTLWNDKSWFTYKFKDEKKYVKGDSRYNVGLLTGEINNIFVIDIDQHGIDGEESFKELENILGPIPETVESLTGGGGRQLFFKYPKDCKIINGSAIVPGIDVRTNGGYVLIEPSVTQKPYAWNVECHPEDMEMAELPEAWVNFFTEKQTKPKSKVNKEHAVRKYKMGGRNNCLFKLASSYRANGMSDKALLPTMLIENQERCEPPLDEAEVETIVESVCNFEVGYVDVRDNKNYKNILDFLFTEVGNGKRLVNRYGEDIRFNCSKNQWMIWNGKRWEEDIKCRIEGFAKQITIDLLQATYDIDKSEIKEDEQSKYEKICFAKSSQSRSSVKSMIFLAKTENNIPVVEGDFDKDKYLFNCSNGTIDLRTQSFKQHNRKDMLSKMSNVIYNPDCYCDKWIDYIKFVFNNEHEVIDYMQKYWGYSLSALIDDQSFIMLLGKGSNGKSQFLEILKYVLGPQQYFSELKSDSVIARKNINSANEARSDLAKLRGSRAVWVSELNANQTLDQSLMKTLTGDKNMTCRYLHQNEFVMDITFKLFMATNEKVSIKDPTDGLWRRMRLIPLVNQIAESEKITDYAEKILIPEASGILNWMLDGYKKYQKDGLIVPSYIKKANREYRTNCDIIEDFIEDCCVIGPEYKILRTNLNNKFKEWAITNGMKTTFSSKSFNSQIDSKGFITKKINGNRFFSGIQLKENMGQL